MTLVLGVDGGGTKTTVAIMDEHKRLVATGSAGSSNVDDHGFETATNNLGMAVRAAWTAAKLEPQPFAAVFLGMGGVSSASDRAIAKRMALRLELAAERCITADDDARSGIMGGLSGRAGFALIAGTGSACIGLNSNGEIARAGGWGPMFDDVGSGHWLGLEAMRAAVRAFDGRGQATVLLEVIRQRLGLHEMREMLHRLYVEGLSRSEIAALAPAVLEAVAAGDLVAQEILKLASLELVQLVHAAATPLAMLETRNDLALIGGLWNSSTFRQSFETTLGQLLPNTRAILPEAPPEVGACWLALESLMAG